MTLPRAGLPRAPSLHTPRTTAAPVDGRLPPADAATLEAEGHALIARGHALLAEAARIRAQGSAVHDDADELVPLCRSGLAVRTRRKLEREGRLPVVKLGRSKFTRRSALLALLDATTGDGPRAPGQHPSTPQEAARASYARTAGCRAARSS